MTRTLQQRATGILINPQSEWMVVAVEPETIQGLFKRYILPLAAIPAVATFLNRAFIGQPFGGRFGLIRSLVAALVLYALSLASVITAAVVIEWLAPRFKSRGGTVEALKQVAYATTPVWIAGIFDISLALAPLTIIAVLYAVYLFYLGLPAVMRTPPDQVVPFMVVAAIAILVVNIILTFLIGGVGLRTYGSI
jgi:hypothetical protein